MFVFLQLVGWVVTVVVISEHYMVPSKPADCLYNLHMRTFMELGFGEISLVQGFSKSDPVDPSLEKPETTAADSQKSLSYQKNINSLIC